MATPKDPKLKNEAAFDKTDTPSQTEKDNFLINPIRKNSIHKGSGKTICIIGAGPAGLMAADRLSSCGFEVTVYEKMPSVARKFLMAGRGGLNLTHAEDFETLVGRYGSAAPVLRPCLEAFTPQDLRAFADALGAETFVGSSGRVFPKAMKASPLLRAWLRRLNQHGVEFKLRHIFTGFEGKNIRFDTPDGQISVACDLTLLALGGASWPRLGGDGTWQKTLRQSGVSVNEFVPSNMGFKARLSPDFFHRFAGLPLKNIEIRFGDQSVRGDLMITKDGLEGGAIYALSASLREALKPGEPVAIRLDLRPDLSHASLSARLAKPQGKMSQSNYLRKALNLNAQSLALLKQTQRPLTPDLIKVCPVFLTEPKGLERAISSAGGIELNALTNDFELKALPNVYALGEMLDWEAPTGGYLLQACFSMGFYTAHRLMQKYHQFTS